MDLLSLCVSRRNGDSSSFPTHARATKYVFVSKVFCLRKFIPGTAKSMTLTYDLGIQGNMILHAILPISATTRARAIEIGKVTCKIM